jgi:hypothetical protein
MRGKEEEEGDKKRLINDLEWTFPREFAEGEPVSLFHVGEVNLVAF